MRNFLEIVLFAVVLHGVFGEEVMEGESVYLNPEPTKIKGFNKIKWAFGVNRTVIAEADDTESSYPYNERFKNKLQLDRHTGSLTIKNMKSQNSGLYEVHIFHNNETPCQKFNVTVSESPPEDSYEDKMNIVQKIEGEDVFLQTDIHQPYGDELIVWRFGDKGKLIAKHDMEAKSSQLYDETDERFRNRLKLDQTGSLTIKNTRITDSGLYKVKIISSNKQTLYKTFTVAVSVSGSSLSKAVISWIVLCFLILVLVLLFLISIYYWNKTSTLKELMSKMSNGVKQLTKSSKQLNQLSKNSEELNKLCKECEKEFKKISGKELPRLSEKLKRILEISEQLNTLPEISDHLSKLSANCEKQMLEINEQLKQFYEESLPLHIRKSPNPTIQNDEESVFITAKETAISQVKRGPLSSIDDDDDEMGKCRLQVNKKTGSLTSVQTSGSNAEAHGN